MTYETNMDPVNGVDSRGEGIDLSGAGSSDVGLFEFFDPAPQKRQAPPSRLRALFVSAAIAIGAGFFWEDNQRRVSNQPSDPIHHMSDTDVKDVLCAQQPAGTKTIQALGHTLTCG